ncbi:hypothetical protein SFR_1874 [Streptomyces sp. FR-008]|nr:hypothetical protein SFR_1874 [Streptomyces sp. FR-008]
MSGQPGAQQRVQGGEQPPGRWGRNERAGGIRHWRRRVLSPGTPQYRPTVTRIAAFDGPAVRPVPSSAAEGGRTGW